MNNLHQIWRELNKYWKGVDLQVNKVIQELE